VTSWVEDISKYASGVSINYNENRQKPSVARAMTVIDSSFFIPRCGFFQSIPALLDRGM
jgi:hypothetical protein